MSSSASVNQVRADSPGATQTTIQPAKISAAVAERLARQLEQAIEGEVRFDRGTRALYAADASLYRQVPIGVVIPRSLDDVRRTVALCRAAEVPVLPRGAGTSLAGQCCNVAVVLDFTKYLNKVLSVDPRRHLARVQPGCVLDDLRNAAEVHGLTFGPDPSTHNHNSLGGMLGNNSCGVHSVMAGRTADNVRSLRILTYDGVEMEVGPTSASELEEIVAAGGRRGEIFAGLKRIREDYASLMRERYPDIPRRVSGYNLDELLPEKGFNVARALVGSEGTCVLILEAELELVESPPHRVGLVLGYKDVYQAGDHVSEILKAGPIGLEGMDQTLFDEMALKQMHPEARDMLPEGTGWLFLEFGGDTQEAAKHQALTLMEKIRPGSSRQTVANDGFLRVAAGPGDTPSMVLVEDKEAQAKILRTRESGLAATTRSPELGDTWPGWEDAAVPPERIGNYLRDFRKLLHSFGYDAAVYGHFGDGCVHCRINFDIGNAPGRAKWREFMTRATKLVVSYGGSLSGEHGDGQVRAELLPLMYGPELVEVMRQFKALWDPQAKMNPGKVIDPYPMTGFLRGKASGPVSGEYAFAQDDHSFAQAVDRCVGVGECRRKTDGVMCPSYRATLEEQHSTRGRARLLFEMLRGDVLQEGWREPSVREALDLCLACKGCKSDCPVGVDMATLKAEFMAHHFRGRLRPRAAYSMGLIWWWSRVASLVPNVANYFLQTPTVAKWIKKLGGIAEQRTMPRYASQTFRNWFKTRAPMNVGLPQVLLWPDTFNNYFQPGILQAAVQVLEAAGYQVRIPRKTLCCGRPLYAEGMLHRARQQLEDILDDLTDVARQGVPVVGLEPSCVAAFRDELPELCSRDARAHYFAHHTYLLTEFLHSQGYHPPKLSRQALVHTHCHQHASLDRAADRVMLERLGLDFTLLNSGCCGMAGSFGFDAHKYDMSLAIGEQQVLPAVRKAPPDTMIITNGFSCREQITQATGRRIWHMAEVLELALREGEPTLALLATENQRGVVHEA